MRHCSRLLIAGLLLGAAGPGAFARAADPQPVIVADFEQAADARLVASRKGAALSNDISSRGRSSLKLHAGDYLNIRTQRLGLARRGDLLRIDLFNAGAEPGQVRAEVFDAAARQSYRRLLAAYPAGERAADAAYGLASCAYNLGEHEAAIASHRRAAELTDHSPNFKGQLGRAYALAGKQSEAREILDELLKTAEQSYISSLDIAIIHAALGDEDRAFEWLEKAYQERADHLPYLKVNPRLDQLRGDPRFEDLLRRMWLD